MKSHRIWSIWKPFSIRFFKSHRIFRPIIWPHILCTAGYWLLGLLRFHSATIHTSQTDTSCLLRLWETQTPAIEMVNFISKSGVFFRGVQLNDFMNSYISCGKAPPRIIGASDLAIGKVWFNPNKGRLSIMNLTLPGPVARHSDRHYCKSKMQDTFSRACSRVSKR